MCSASMTSAASLGVASSRIVLIRVRPISVRELEDGLALAVYEEWQNGPEGESAWTSSALLRRDPTAPGGIRWLHVHETYLPGMESV